MFSNMQKYSFRNHSCVNFINIVHYTINLQHTGQTIRVQTNSLPQKFMIELGSYRTNSFVEKVQISGLALSRLTYIKFTLGCILNILNILLVVRIISDWFPRENQKFSLPLAYYLTEPLLRVTRKTLAPIGGVDVSAIVWFAIFSFANEIVCGSQGLLNLLDTL